MSSKGPEMPEASCGQDENRRAAPAEAGLVRTGKGECRLSPFQLGYGSGEEQRTRTNQRKSQCSYPSWKQTVGRQFSKDSRIIWTVKNNVHWTEKRLRGLFQIKILSFLSPSVLRTFDFKAALDLLFRIACFQNPKVQAQILMEIIKAWMFQLLLASCW